MQEVWRIFDLGVPLEKVQFGWREERPTSLQALSLYQVPRHKRINK